MDTQRAEQSQASDDSFRRPKVEKNLRVPGLQRKRPKKVKNHPEERQNGSGWRRPHHLPLSKSYTKQNLPNKDKSRERNRVH